jgi:hypothetical protein
VVSKQIKRDLRKGEHEDESLWDYVIKHYYQTFLLSDVVLPITETTKQQIKRVLEDKLKYGWGIAETVRQLKNSDLTKYRAELIVRTESMRATNTGAMIAAAGSPVAIMKRWISAQDNRTRRIPRNNFDHLHMNGVTVDFDKPFIVPSLVAVEDMQMPGDPEASAGNVCNCFLPDQLTSVNPDIVKKAFRSFYDGQVVTINCANGKSFTCTPNHPILTAVGWHKASMLNKGDYLIQSSLIQDAFCPNFNINNGVTTFEKFYNSFSMVGDVMRKSGVDMDFYGDGSTLDVNVVCSKRLLHGWGVHFKRIKNNLLKCANFAKRFFFSFGSFCKTRFSLFWSRVFHALISTCDKLQFPFQISLTHSQIHRFAPISLSDSVFFKTRNNGSTATPKMLGKSFDAETGIIKGLNLVDSQVLVTNITHKNYSGFVYTLETNEQMYDINSFVAKNCRCTVAFIPIRDQSGVPIATEDYMPQSSSIFRSLFMAAQRAHQSLV